MDVALEAGVFEYAPYLLVGGVLEGIDILLDRSFEEERSLGNHGYVLPQ